MNINIQKPVFPLRITGRKTVPSLRVDDPRRDVSGYHKVDLARTWRKARRER